MKYSINMSEIIKHIKSLNIKVLANNIERYAIKRSELLKHIEAKYELKPNEANSWLTGKLRGKKSLLDSIKTEQYGVLVLIIDDKELKSGDIIKL